MIDQALDPRPVLLDVAVADEQDGVGTGSLDEILNLRRSGQPLQSLWIPPVGPRLVAQGECGAIEPWLQQLCFGEQSQRTEVLALALFLLGLGWNFCAVSGAALLTDSLNLSERSRLQGSNDLAVGLVSAMGSLQSGALFEVIGYANLAWISLALSLIPALLALRLLIFAARARPPLPLHT